MVMAQDLLKGVITLLNAYNDLPDGEREYALRFVRANSSLTGEEFIEKWTMDRADREEAARLQAHRDEKVLEDYRDVVARRGETAVKVTGIAADGSTEPSKAKGK